jgi:hypothetical protein
MSTAYDEHERRVQERARQIWQREGRPGESADAYLALAREEVAQEEGIGDTLKPNPMTDDGEPDAEPLLAVEGMADIPGRLSDQGERQDYPSPPASSKKDA